MSEETKNENSHDEHHDHSFPDWVTFGHTDDPVNGFIKVFAWLVFWTILEVLAIVQEFDSFAMNMLILFGSRLIRIRLLTNFLRAPCQNIKARFILVSLIRIVTHAVS